LSWFESMRGSHSTRFKLAHGRPFDTTEYGFSPKRAHRTAASHALSKPKARRMGCLRYTVGI
jgi:hypothetical protein